MPFTLTQDDSNFNDSSGTVLTVPMGVDVTLGELLVVTTAFDGAQATIVISDTRATTWRLAGIAEEPAGGAKVAMHWGVLQSSGPNTITQTLGAGRPFRTCTCSQYAGGLVGLDVLGKSTQHYWANSGPNAQTEGMEVLTEHELGVAIIGNSLGSTSNATGGWTERMEPGGSDTQIQDFISPPMGELAATWTNIDDDYVMVAALFRSQNPAPPPGGGAVGNSASRLYATRYRRY